MADVRESVFESTEMESIRIDLELDKQVPGGSGLCFSPIDNRDSGLPDIEQSLSDPLELSNGHASTSATLTSPSYVTASTGSAHKYIASPTAGTMNGAHHVSYHIGTRRLSFNSMDSGMIEENGVDLSV